MRKTIAFLLMAATAATPLAAQAQSFPGNRPESRDDRRGNPDWRADNVRDRGEVRDRQRDVRDDRRDRWEDRRGDQRDWRDERRADQRDWRNDRRDWRDDRRGDNRWNNGWRSDRRYDWQNYRDRNRAAYRVPRYYGPRGHDYRRWSSGYRIQPSFYGRNYWINDPWQYRLPPAYGSYRWVRYYDDVMLVDVRSGLIEDIIYSFFWR